jgi:hypothetical protein
MVKFEIEQFSKKGNKSLGEFDLPASTTIDALTDQLQARSKSLLGLLRCWFVNFSL